jgi:hypothetical protein
MITALQNSALTGSMGETLMPMPTRVAMTMAA